MLNVDLNGRLSFPTTVGSSSREGRLHQLMEQTLSSRRSSLMNSREALPRLSSKNHTKSIPNLTEAGAKGGTGVGQPSRMVKIRKASTGETLVVPTSVSCPTGIGRAAAADEGSPYRTRVDMRLSLSDRRLDMANSHKHASPRLGGRKRNAMVGGSLEKLPPVIGEEEVCTGGKNNENKENLSTSRLPRVGGAPVTQQRRKKRMPSVGLGRVNLDRSGSRASTTKDSECERVISQALVRSDIESDDEGPVSIKHNSSYSSLNKLDNTGPPTRINSRSPLVKGHELEQLSDREEGEGGERQVQTDRPKKNRKISRGLKRTSTVSSMHAGSAVAPSRSSHRKSGVPPGSAKQQEWYIPRFLHKGEALKLFRRSVRKVWLVLSWFNSLQKKHVSTDQTLKSFLDMAKDIEESTNTHDIEEKTGLTFDPKQYSAKKEVCLSEESRAILTTPTRDRSTEMIQKVLPILQNQKAFAEYPLHMQHKFAKVAWFQEVPPKRVILKQGHYAENFYFILSGKAIVKLITKDAGGDLVMRAVARMQAGQSFGEVALLQQSVRTATVESANHMHILVITREDFQRIFFNTLDGQDPDHIIFCKKQVSFLRDFPIDLSMSIPGTCLFHFFRPGAVVVNDSKTSEWIYIVRSGSCQVLKRLDAVNPSRPWVEKKLDLRVKLPRNGTAEPGPRIDTRLRNHEGYEQGQDESDGDDFSLDEEYQKFEDEKDEEEEEVGEGERVRVTRFQLPARPVTTVDKSMPPIKETPVGTDTANENNKRKKAPKSAPTPNKTPKINDGKPAKPGFSKSKLFFLPEIKKAYITPVMPAAWAYLDDEDDDRLTLADAMTIEARSTRSVRTQRNREPPKKPACFVQLKVLRPRDAFGLEMVKFDDDQNYDVSDNTSVTLVSKGCELIMLSRRFFERHASEHSKQYIREKVRPFPPDDTLQHNLQIEVNWDLFRKDTVGDFVDFMKETREITSVR